MTDIDKVRVLDPVPPRPVAPSGGGKGSWVVAGLSLLVALSLWVTGGRSGDDERVVPINPAALAEPEPQSDGIPAPDVAGLTLPEARQELLATGAIRSEAAVTTSWVASNLRDAGLVLGQSPVQSPPGVQLIVSSGGPVVEFRELPAYLREWAIALPGFDPSEPILATATAAGTAYKTDHWLFGECGAVELAYRTYPDPAYDEDCVVRETTSVTGVLLDGTRYRVVGLPEGSYGFESVAGVIMYESEAGARALGITTHGRTQVDSSLGVGLSDRTLTVEAGTWQMAVSIYPAFWTDLPSVSPDQLVTAFFPALDGELPVVGLRPPLRWQRPGELPSRIEVDYGAFRVVAGCVPNVTNVACDATGHISVEGALTGFDVSGVSVFLELDTPRSSVQDIGTGIRYELPESWNAATERLTSVSFPREVLSVATFELQPGGVRCAHIPDRALRDVGPTDVLLTVFIGGSENQPPWPRPFSRSDLVGEVTDAHECAERPELDVGVGSYQLNGVPMFVLVAFGDDVSVETEVGVWRLLDSLDVNEYVWIVP